MGIPGTSALALSRQAHTDGLSTQSLLPVLRAQPWLRGLWVLLTGFYLITTPCEMCHYLSHLNYDTLWITRHNLISDVLKLENLESSIPTPDYQWPFLAREEPGHPPGRLLLGWRGALEHFQSPNALWESCILLVLRPQVLTASHRDPAALALNTCA